MLADLIFNGSSLHLPVPHRHVLTFTLCTHSTVLPLPPCFVFHRQASFSLEVVEASMYGRVAWDVCTWPLQFISDLRCHAPERMPSSSHEQHLHGHCDHVHHPHGTKHTGTQGNSRGCGIVGRGGRSSG
jgi:hypothetical protein